MSKMPLSFPEADDKKYHQNSLVIWKDCFQDSKTNDFASPVQW